METASRRTGFLMKTAETGSYSIAGFRSRHPVDASALIRAFEQAGWRVQPVRACIVFGREHLISAYMHAARALDRGESASMDLMTEVALYAGCSRQLSKSLEAVRVENETEIALVAVPALDGDEAERITGPLGLARDDRLLEINSGKLKYAGLLGVDGVDCSTAADAVLERIALIDVER